MKHQLSFNLLDRYSMKIWNPSLLDDDFKAINGEFFFSVIYSIFREKSKEHKNISTTAKNVLAKFTKEMSKFENEIKGLIKLAELKKAESEFTIAFSEQKLKKITFTPASNGGVCPENSLFLRSFIKFDQYVSLLNELKSMAIIEDKEYYIQRKQAQSRLSGIMEGYYALIKNFHTQRKKYEKTIENNSGTKSLESVA